MFLSQLNSSDSIFSFSAPREKIAVHYAFDRTFDLKYEWINEKIIWAQRLWVGARKENKIGYVSWAYGK